jgi:ubiquinone/menaquinone biosynthesis C-methylase UbiE
MLVQDTEPRRRKLLPEMEGFAARSYAKLRGSEAQLAAYRQQAERLTEKLAAGSSILEVAPGPGFFAVELARLGRFQVTGLDISHTFVRLATELAARTGVQVDFRHGDATAMPFPAAQFELIVCQAAFKNFARPVTALDEMYRVLRPGGHAVIQDMSAQASKAAIAAEVEAMGVGRLAAFTTRQILTGLRRRAYSPGQFNELAQRSTFGGATVSTEGIGLEVRLAKALVEHRATSVGAPTEEKTLARTTKTTSKTT